MSSSPPTETYMDAAFVCDCDAWARLACEGLSFFKAHEGKRYCVLHYPGQDKVAAFNKALEIKLDTEDFDFRGVWFPAEVSFAKVTFGADAYFTRAQFSATADFSEAQFGTITDFSDTRFDADANFYNTQFGGIAYFLNTHFSAEANFFGAQFQGDAYLHAQFSVDANFGYTQFSAAAYFGGVQINGVAYFRGAQFNGTVIFNYAVFNATVNFLETRFFAKVSPRSDSQSGDNEATVAGDAFKADAEAVNVSFNVAIFKDVLSFKENVFAERLLMSFDAAIFEKPQRVTFHSTSLRPHWFINVDTRKFEFINVDWNWRDISIKQEIKRIPATGVLQAHRLLAIACRNLAVNAEENHRYEEASRFRYMAMDARRLERWRGFAFWTLGWWYWLASGYGERMGRALLVLLGILVLFAALYMGLGFSNWETKAATEKAAVESQRKETGGWPQLSGALLYSANVMTLQKPEPRPATNWAQTFVMLETILGPVQAALLALAIRRKFMR
jgi:hypothetical protein